MFRAENVSTHNGLYVVCCCLECALIHGEAHTGCTTPQRDTVPSGCDEDVEVMQLTANVVIYSIL